MTARTARAPVGCHYGTTTGNDSHPRTVDVCAHTALSPSTSGWHHPRLLCATIQRVSTMQPAMGPPPLETTATSCFRDLAIAGFAS